MIAGNEVHKRALARTGLTHQGYRAAPRDLQADIVQDRPAGIVGEPHMIQADRGVQTVCLDGMFCLPDGILGRENLADALHAGQSLLDGIAGLREVLDGLERRIEDNQIVDEHIGIYAAAPREDEPATEPQDDDDHHRTQELADGMGRTLAHGYAVGDVAILVVDLHEALHHLVLGDEGLDDAQAAQRLLNLAHTVRQAALHKQRAGLQLLAYRTDSPGQQGHHQQGEEGELPAEAYHSAQVNEDEDRVLDHHVQRAADAGIHLVDIGRDAGEDIPLALLGKEAEGQLEYLPVDVLPDVAQDTGAQRHEHSRAAEVGGCLEECEQGQYHAKQE